MKDLVQDVNPKYKLNYNLFKLDPAEKDAMSRAKKRRRNFFNPGDPFF